MIWKARNEIALNNNKWFSWYMSIISFGICCIYLIKQIWFSSILGLQLLSNGNLLSFQCHQLFRLKLMEVPLVITVHLGLVACFVILWKIGFQDTWTLVIFQQIPPLQSFIQYGLKVAKEVDCIHVICETDSTISLQFISKGVIYGCLSL